MSKQYFSIFSKVVGLLISDDVLEFDEGIFGFLISLVTLKVVVLWCDSAFESLEWFVVSLRKNKVKLLA